MKRDVPAPDAVWAELWEFALTYQGYMRRGGFEAAAGDANRTRERWESDGVLPDSLDAARLALFFEQRRWHHFGEEPSGCGEEYVRALVERIASISGGVVRVDRDGVLNRAWQRVVRG